MVPHTGSLKINVRSGENSGCVGRLVLGDIRVFAGECGNSLGWLRTSMGRRVHINMQANTCMT